MASGKMLSNILRSSICFRSFKGQHTLARLVTQNSSCVGDITYRKFSTSLIRNDTAHKEERTQKEITDYVNEELKKGWAGFGFYPFDRYRDTVTGNLAFLIVAVISVVPIFVYYYCPDYQLKNWANREAHLLLKQREDAGIFPISKDFIHPEKVALPSDEELGDIDVKI